MRRQREALVQRLVPAAARVEDVGEPVVARASARRSSRTTRPRPAGTSVAARASIPMVCTVAVVTLARRLSAILGARAPADRAQPRLPRARRDRRHGDLRPRADPAAGRARRRARSRASSTARRPRPAAGRGATVAPMEVVPVRARSRVEWVRGEQQHVPRIAARIGADLVHCLASTAPLWGSVPRVTTIHDLNYLLVPEAHFGLRGLGMRALVPLSARRSRRVIVDAASTRDELVRHLRVPAGKIDVVPLAAGAARRRGARARRRAARAARARRAPGRAAARAPSARTRTSPACSTRSR